jgi:hypothetical protein
VTSSELMREVVSRVRDPSRRPRARYPRTELARSSSLASGVPLSIIQRQLGHGNLGRSGFRPSPSAARQGLSIALRLAQAAQLPVRRLTVWDGIGVPMYHSPLAVFEAEHGGDAQLVRLGWGVSHRCRCVLDCGDVGEIAADACREHLVRERLAVREPRGNPLENGCRSRRLRER